MHKNGDTFEFYSRSLKNVMPHKVRCPPSTAIQLLFLQVMRPISYQCKSMTCWWLKHSLLYGPYMYFALSTGILRQFSNGKSDFYLCLCCIYAGGGCEGPRAQSMPSWKFLDPRWRGMMMCHSLLCLFILGFVRRYFMLSPLHECLDDESFMALYVSPNYCFFPFLARFFLWTTAQESPFHLEHLVLIRYDNLSCIFQPRQYCSFCPWLLIATEGKALVYFSV